MQNYRTIREAARDGILNEHILRQLVARGECPGIRSGNRFYVDVARLKEQLGHWSEERRDGDRD